MEKINCGEKMRVPIIIIIIMILVLSACEKTTKIQEEKSWQDILSDERGDIILDAEYDKIIIEPIVQPDNCDYIVSGIIHFVAEDEVIAVLDYGEGTCDEWATVTKDGETFDIDLSKDEDEDWKKIIIEPLIEIENCEYIVAGIIKLYKEGEWIVTIDFGNGTCDEWATKTWNGGSEELSMAVWK
jgi:hypothetical protein